MATASRLRLRLGMALAAIVFSLVSFVPSAASADDSDAAFQKGLACYDAGDYACAISTWEKLLTTLDEDHAWRLLFNLGLAHQAAGDVNGAIERFETFLHKLAEQPAKMQPQLEAKRLEAAERVRKLKETNGALHVLEHPSRDVLVRIDRGAARPSGFTVYVAPGEHVVEVRPETPKARRIPVRATAGSTVDVNPADPPAPPPPPVTAAPPAKSTTTSSEPRSFPTGWLIAGVAVTAASTALPIALTLVAKSKKDDAVALGPGSTRYPTEVDRFHTARTTAEVSWALPAILAIATVVVVLVELPSDGGASSRASRRSLEVAF